MAGDIGSILGQGTKILPAAWHGKKKTRRKFCQFVTIRMDLEGTMLSKISQAEKDKYSDLNDMWNLKRT